MSWKGKIYWLHKWSAALVVVLALIWFVSGVVMVLPPRLFGARSETLGMDGAPNFQDIKVSVPQAISLLESELGKTLAIRQVTFRQVAGRLYYQLQTGESGSHLIDTESGARLVIKQETAVRLLTAAVPQVTPREVTLLEQPSTDYAFGTLPVYRIKTAESPNTNYYVVVETGEIRRTNSGWRTYRFLRGTHTLEFLRPVLGARLLRATMLSFSVLGTLMTLFGVGILWIQFANWRRQLN